MYIKKLTDKNIRVSTVFTVNQINYKEALDTYKLAKTLHVVDFSVGGVVAHNDSHTDLIVSNKDLFKLYYELSQVKSQTEPFLSVNPLSIVEVLNIPEVRKIIEEPYYQDLIKKYYTQKQSVSCQTHNKIAIHSDGTVYLCLEALAYNIAPLGNYKENSMLEIWENRHNNILFKPRKVENMRCNKCKYNTLCNSGCMVQSYITSKDINTPQVPSCRPALM